jgi:hypothetical protein
MILIAENFYTGKWLLEREILPTLHGRKGLRGKNR